MGKSKSWTIEQWLGTIILGFVFVLGFGIGFGLGRIGREVEIQVEERIVHRPFLDLTLSKEKQLQRLNAYANTLNLVVVNLQKHQEKKRIIESSAWQRGFEKGYEKAR